MLYLCFTYGLPMVYLWFIMILPTHLPWSVLGFGKWQLVIVPITSWVPIKNPRTIRDHPIFSTLEDLTTITCHRWKSCEPISNSHHRTFHLSCISEQPATHSLWVAKNQRDPNAVLNGPCVWIKSPHGEKSQNFDVVLNLAFWEESKISYS